MWSADYEEQKRNTASSGFLNILNKIDAMTFFWGRIRPEILLVYTVTLYKKEA
jgi:hypothetical protein